MELVQQYNFFIMKKLILISTILAFAFSYSCNKDKKVNTTINGQLLTNGTTSVIKLSTELEKPKVCLYQETGTSDLISGNGFEEIKSVLVDENAKYNFDIDLWEEKTYFIGFHNVDTSIYLDVRPDQWHGINDFNHITPGTSNSINLYVLAKSWVRPRFINTNPNPNNLDIFKLVNGIGGPEPGIVLQPFKGPTDTVMSWIYKTWSGTYKYGVKSMSHTVDANLTRNGITKYISILYNVPPFDTTIVEIRY